MTAIPTTTSFRRVKIVFGVLIFLSVALVASAFVIRPFAGMFLHDSNFQTFDDVLTAEQRAGIFMSVGSIVMIYILLLVASNVLWMAGAWYLVSRCKSSENLNVPVSR
jgi:uncharacterized membrane protein YjgN (DUF898 family)